MRETQESIEQWRAETFGPAGSAMRMAARANEEMAELLREIAAGSSDKAAHECADIVILLFGMAEILGIDLLDAVDSKMCVNRLREWTLDDTGHGYHKRVAAE
jgi:NTP pyrophosphatase (non-canonical NTP hydrolase)